MNYLLDPPRHIQIILENLSLIHKFKYTSIVHLIEQQEKLISEWESLGYTRESFFKEARSAAKYWVDKKV